MAPIDPDTQRELDRLDKRLLAIEAIPMKVATLETVQDGQREDIAEIKQILKDLDRSFASYRKGEREERKNDRRWTIGAVLVAAGLVAPALTLLLDKT